MSNPKPHSKEMEKVAALRRNGSSSARDNTVKGGYKIYKELFDNSISGIVVANYEGEIVLTNPRLCKMLGYGEKNLLGMQVRGLFAFGQWRVLSKVMNDLKTGKKNQILLSTACLHKDGHSMNHWVSFNLIAGMESIPRCFLIVLHNNSEFTIAERDADDNRKYYQAISDNAFDAVLVIENGICIDANPAAVEMFGIPSEALIGMPGEDLATPENRSAAHERISSGDESPYHAVAMKRDGTRFHVMVQVKIVRMGEREIRITMLRDIDRQIRAEKAFEESERHLRSLMVSATDFVLFRLRRNPDDLEQPDVIFVSPSVKDFVDASWEPDFNQWLGLLHPGDSQDLMESTNKMLENQRMDKRVRMRDIKDGSWRWLRIVCSTVSDENGDLYFNGIVLDETGEVEALESLKARERELRQYTESLSEVNTALEVLLRKREADRTEVEEKMLKNAKSLILPYLEKLKQSKLDKRQRMYLNLVESNINEFVSPLTQRMSRHYLTFTPLEIQVANLVKEGKTTKDIAQILGLSARTIESVRYTIRRKLGITEKRANLRNHLLSISDGGNFSFRE